MKIDKNSEPIETDDFWYDVFEGGYIKPSEFLCEGADEVRRAIETLEEFQSLMEEHEKVEYI